MIRLEILNEKLMIVTHSPILLIVFLPCHPSSIFNFGGWETTQQQQPRKPGKKDKWRQRKVYKDLYPTEAVQSCAIIYHSILTSKAQSPSTAHQTRCPQQAAGTRWQVQDTELPPGPAGPHCPAPLLPQPASVMSRNAVMLNW